MLIALAMLNATRVVTTTASAQDVFQATVYQTQPVTITFAVKVRSNF